MILCPRKTILIDPSKWEDHVYKEAKGIHVFLEQGLADRLFTFLPVFKQFRTDRKERYTDASVYPQLPFVNFDTGMWKLRALDLELINSQLKEKPDSDILEIGAWNGWLTHRLTQAGHSLTAIDFFEDEFDGLGAKRHYENAPWTSIQMDTEALHVFEKKFDVILFNRCISYFTDIVGCLEKAQKLLAPGGKIIITGIHVIQEKEKYAAHYEALRASFQEEYGIELFFKPAEKLFEQHHHTALAGKGFSFLPYPRSLKARLTSWLRPQKPMQFYAVFNA